MPSHARDQPTRRSGVARAPQPQAACGAGPSITTVLAWQKALGNHGVSRALQRVGGKSFTELTGTNRAGVGYDLTLPGGTRLKGRQDAESGAPLAPRWYERAGKPTLDAEAVLLDWMADEVLNAEPPLDPTDVAAYLERAGAARGAVSIGSDMGPCRECRKVIRAFAAEFKQVAIVVKYDGERAVRVVGGDWGSYGYDDAEPDGPGRWSKKIQ